MPKNYCIMQIWAESGKSALPICNYSQILYQFLTFTQNLKRSQEKGVTPLLGLHQNSLNTALLAHGKPALSFFLFQTFSMILFFIITITCFFVSLSCCKQRTASCTENERPHHPHETVSCFWRSACQSGIHILIYQGIG